MTMLYSPPLPPTTFSYVEARHPKMANAVERMAEVVERFLDDDSGVVTVYRMELEVALAEFRETAAMRVPSTVSVVTG